MDGRSLSFVAPARVNLIGEHTDYTGGLVLPMAVPFYTHAKLTPANDGMYRFTSDQFPTERAMPLEDRGAGTHDWSDYPVGVLRELQKLGHEPAPFHLSFTGDVPLGSGLSSSASIEVSTAFALLEHLGATLPPEEIAQLCRRAENGYVGAASGIMDQSVIVMAEEGHALLLDTESLHHEAVPMNCGSMAGVSVVVCNSMVKHSIAAGEYGNRRQEVDAGQAAVVKARPGLRDLGQASMEDLERVRAQISPESFRRCRHIITENGRVRAMKTAMLAGDAHTAGDLMLQAHASERDDFACSTPEIDFMVERASQLPGCFGGRLTGGGFGGCTVNLLRADAVESFTAELTAAYREKFNLQMETYVCEAVDGALRRNKLRGTADEEEAGA